MRTIDIIKRAARGLKSAKGRTILTSLSIAIGAFTISLALAAGNGVKSETKRFVEAQGFSNQVFVTKKAPESKEAVDANKLEEFNENAPVENTPRYGLGAIADVKSAMLSKADILKLEKVEGVTEVQAIQKVSARFIQGANAKRLIAPNVVTVDYQSAGFGSGTVQSYPVVGAGEIAVPSEILASLGYKNAEEAMGKKLTVNFAENVALSRLLPTTKTLSREFTIVKVTTATEKEKVPSQPLVIAKKDFLELGDIQNTNSPASGYYTGAIAIISQADTKEQRDEMQAKLAAAGDYQVETIDSALKIINQVINIIQIIVVSMGGIALIASIFGIINTQYISVLQRTREIGLYKALGMRRSKVMRLFQFEAAWIGFLGGLIGVGCAYVTALIANPIISNSISLPGISNLRFLQMDLLQTLGLTAGLILIAMLAGYFPARKAAKLDPIEALRTE